MSTDPPPGTLTETLRPRGEHRALSEALVELDAVQGGEVAPARRAGEQSVPAEGPVSRRCVLLLLYNVRTACYPPRRLITEHKYR